MVLSSNVTIGIVTGLFAFIGIVMPIVLQFAMWKSPNKGVAQVCFALTGACLYLFWLSTYLCQLNPLIGPQLETNLIRMIQYEWPIDK